MRPSGFLDTDQSQNVVWINNSRTAWPPKVFYAILSSLKNLF